MNCEDSMMKNQNKTYLIVLIAFLSKIVTNNVGAQMYSGKSGIDFHIFSLYRPELLYKKAKKLEIDLDRIIALQKKIYLSKFCKSKRLEKLIKIFDSKRSSLQSTYKILAGYSVWLRRETIKQQCEIIKKINEVLK